MTFVSLCISGVTVEVIVDALHQKYPDRKIVYASKTDSLNSSDIFILQNVDTTDLLSELDKKQEELRESEAACSRALESIQTFHKQQHDLFDEFVILRQRYDEQKSILKDVLWTQCSQHHPELRQIPRAEDAATFEETDEIVGSYIVGNTLGEGQFANVRSCVKNSGDDDLALKIIKKERILNFHGLRRVSNEIETLRKLNSKYIICLHDVIQTDSNLYIVTEKGGPDLFDFFDEHPNGVPEHWAKEIMYRILRAVQYCHTHSYCHRDLKPEVSLSTYFDLSLFFIIMSVNFRSAVLEYIDEL